MTKVKTGHVISKPLLSLPCARDWKRDSSSPDRAKLICKSQAHDIQNTGYM